MTGTPDQSVTPDTTERERNVCSRRGCEEEARQSVLVNWMIYYGCPEHYGQILRDLGVR